MSDYPHINAEDIRIFSWPSKPKTGFQIGVGNGVHIIHLPTKMEFKVDSERSQHRNKHIALTQLNDALKDQAE